MELGPDASMGGAPQMESFTDAIGELGREVERQYVRANSDQRRLPDIGAQLLEDFGAIDEIDLNVLARFLRETRIRQQPRNPFSDLPLTVFHSRDFHIELLVWSSATTAIHQHGFSGAFRLVRGSSIHTLFRFRSLRHISNDCQLGKVSPAGSEALRIGDVRRIDPGMTGLIHSLYHLDDPSISLIIRTSGHSAFGPQFSYYPPSLALHRKALESDELVLMISRLLDVCRSTDRGLFQSLWNGDIAALDFPRMGWIYLRNHRHLTAKERKEFFNHSVRYHGDLARHLFDAVTRYEQQLTLVQLRAQVRDPELRFFLALLMNVPDRNDLLEMVRQRFPRADPVERCADWLGELSIDDQGEMYHMKQVAEFMESSARQTIALGRKIRRTLPDEADPALVREIFKRFVEGRESDEIEQAKGSISPEHESTLRALAAIPQLKSLC